METITVRTQNGEQMAFIKDLLANLRWEVGVEVAPEEDRHWPAIEEGLQKARREKAEGKTTRLSTRNGAGDFWGQVREA